MERREFLGVLSGSALTGLSGCINIDNNNQNVTNNSSEANNSENLISVPNQTVIEPPYKIEYPENVESEWRPDYLGHNMSGDGSVPIKTVDGASVVSNLLSPTSPSSAANEFAARTFSRSADYEGVVTNSQGSNRVNFIDNFMLIVESGYVSSDISHVWKRIEETDSGGYRLFGYYREPFQTEPDLSTKVSILEVPRMQNRVVPDVTVSLVVSRNYMVNFKTGEGVVSVEDIF